ncbi:MAG TPA: oxidase, partial [Rhodopila sp.]|nr:oxidase [Rhodopila sp.]
MVEFGRSIDRRHFFQGAAAAAAIFAASPVQAEDSIKLNLPGGPDERDLTTGFPQKGKMVLQRTRPPLLETPFTVFDRGVFTPNDQFFVRWHWAVIPEAVDVATFKLAVRGHVNTTLSLSMADVLALPRFEIAAVN